jgi:hypothetical protein
MEAFELVRPNHTALCACSRCRFLRRRARFETVSRATYDPDRQTEEVMTKPVLAEEVAVAEVTDAGLLEEFAGPAMLD